MRQWKWTRNLGALAIALAATNIGTPAKADLKVDYLDAEGFANEKSPTYQKLVFYADILDGQDRFLTGFEKSDKLNSIKVFIDDKEVAGTFDVKTFKEANQTLALGLVIAAHKDYVSKDEEGGQTESVLDVALRGYASLLKELSNQPSQVAAWFYNDETSDRVMDWQNKPDQLADEVKKVKGGVSDKKPSMLSTFEKAFKSIQDNPNLPRRRVLLTLSDGQDANGKKTDKRLKVLSDLAADTRAKVYALAYSFSNVTDDFGNLSDLASKTGGVYRKLSADDVKLGDLEGILTDLATELQNQYVITFTPTDWRGAEQPVNIRIELTAPNDAPMKSILEGVKVGQLSTDHWNVWAKWVVYGLGGLLGLGLIWLLIKAIINGRKNRPTEVVEESGPVGPYKGKLTALTGVYAGKEFYLTEDVTTIGSISGNTIVLQEQGVSKRHAGIKIEEMRFELADFGSTNGTFVNGAKVTSKQFLGNGDEIRIGECKLKFSLK
jgi:hypothetical protein